MTNLLLFLFLPRKRKRKDKFRSDALRADAGDIFVVCLNDLFYDGKSKSRAFFVLSAGEICFVEALPDLLDAVLGNTDSGVLDRYENLIVFFRGLDRDGGIGVAELESVVNQVVEHLLDLAHVGGDVEFFSG